MISWHNLIVFTQSPHRLSALITSGKNENENSLLFTSAGFKSKGKGKMFKVQEQLV